MHRMRTALIIYKNKERNDLTCTNTDPLLPGIDLTTNTKQFTTCTDGLFDHADYLHSYIQPLGLYITISAICRILARP